MKIKFLSILALGTFAFVSCTDDSDYNNINTAPGVTVEFADATASYPEDQLSNTTFYNIPVKVTGEANGPVKVTVEASPVGQDGAVADVNFIITSNTIIIPAGDTEGYIEFYPKGDSDVNEDREFNLKIVSAEGAAIGTSDTELITLVDDDHLIPDAYRNIQGVWNLDYSSAYTGAGSSTVQVVGVNEGEEGFNKTLRFVGFPDPDCVSVGTLSVNGVTGRASVSFAVPQIVLVDDFRFQSGLVVNNGQVKSVFATATGGYYGSATGSFTCTANDAYSMMTFDFSGYPAIGYLIYNETTPIGWYDLYLAFSMDR